MLTSKMSKDKEKYKSVFNIAVVGLSGTETTKGACGVGKSCLCNRFVRPLADDYYPEHTSALSQGDFSGRVVSNDMFLYWGDVTKTDDNGLEYKFNIVEQTEFVDDQSYQPHRASNTNYVKRCAMLKLSSAEKLMYICTDQLGIESDFEQKQMPEGKLSIDGFILCFDVSMVNSRTTDDQVKFVQACYHYLSKTKKPIVLVLTKCDDRVEPYVKEAEKFACNPGGKKSSVPIIETSAAENINVELAFMVLAQMIDKARSKSKIISYDDASKVRQEILNQATEDLNNLLSEEVKSYHENWIYARKKLTDKLAYTRYIELLGKNSASRIFRKHVTKLREEYRLAMQSNYLRHLPRAFRMILPDLSLLGTTWQNSISIMKEQPAFNSWFIELESNSTPWFENDHVLSLEDRRIPIELLQTPDAETAYLMHRKSLETKQHKEDMKKAFRETLWNSPQAMPGREWGEIVKYFKQYDFLLELNENELSTIYEQFQDEITEKAKKEFQELLYERAEVFVPNASGYSTRNDIHFALEEDKRYTAMTYLVKDREEIMAEHISGMQFPKKDEWGSKSLKRLVSQIKNSKPPDKAPPSSKWQLKPDSKTLNVVLLGADGLSRELANEITVQSSEDAYNLDGCVHSLRLRCIDGDVASPRNSFKTSDFSPHGCIAVYSSMESLNYIQKSLRHTVLPPCDSKSVIPPPFQGLPVSILLASQASCDQQVTKLRIEGEHLATLLGCPFIDVMEPEYAYNRRFHESQIRHAMRSLINGIKERAGSDSNSRTSIQICDDHDIESDIRIVACTMAEDNLGAEVVLLPLLNHLSCKVLTLEDGGLKKDTTSSCSGEDQEDTLLVGDSLFVETYLGNQRRRIQVTMTSYQSARHLLNRRQTIHGFLLLFDTSRLASFSMMKVFAKSYVSSYPIQIVCMSSKFNKDSFSNSFFRDESAQHMVIEANKLADSLQARFIAVTPNHTKQTEVYTTFFKDAWEQKDQTEAIYDINRAVEDDLEGDFSGLSLDFSKHSQTDDNSSSRPITPEKSSLSGPSAPATSSTESIPTLSRPSVLGTDRSISSPASDILPHIQLSKITPASPALDSETLWNNFTGEFRQESPDTSPTAGLLDNEESPAFRDYGQDQKSSASSSQSSGSMPGKLDPEFLSRMAAGIPVQKPRSKSHHIMHQKSFTEGMSSTQNGHGLPYFDPKKTGQRVLPQLDQANQKSDHLKESSPQSMASPHSISKFFHGKHAASSSALSGADVIRRPTPYKKNNKKNKGGGDNDSADGLRQNRYSTAGILEMKNDNEPTVAALGIRRGTSHEILHPSMTGISAAHTPKEEKILKQRAKDEEKRRRDEEKKREKDQQKRLKEKGLKNGMHGKPSLGTAVIPNNHTVSEYFNKSLDDIIQGLNHLTPLFVEKCVEYIEQFGITFEGLYRIPANAKERENILRRFDEDNSIDLSSLSVTVQTVAGSLTWFFSHKNLPEPLIPYNLHGELEEAISMPDPSWRNVTLRGVIRKLPNSHYATFKYLCTHLNTVCKHESENKMNSENIAICWWPTLFRPDLDDKTGNFKNAGLKDVLLACIEQCAYIFYNQLEV